MDVTGCSGLPDAVLVAIGVKDRSPSLGKRIIELQLGVPSKDGVMNSPSTAMPAAECCAAKVSVASAEMPGYPLWLAGGKLKIERAGPSEPQEGFVILPPKACAELRSTLHEVSLRFDRAGASVLKIDAG